MTNLTGKVIVLQRLRPVAVGAGLLGPDDLLDPAGVPASNSKVSPERGRDGPEGDTGSMVNTCSTVRCSSALKYIRGGGTDLYIEPVLS
jgi:hypothetical protein